MPYNGGIVMGTRATLISSGILALAAMPLSAFAATTNFFGPIIPQGGNCLCATSAMDWGCVIAVVQNVLNLLVSLGVIAVVFFFAWAGFTLVASGGSPAALTKAKNRMLNAVLGLVLILGAWTIIDTIMKVLYNPSAAFTGGTFGPWESVLNANNGAYCLKPNTSPGILTNGSIIGTLINAVNPGTANSSSNPGSCNVASGGPCTVSNLTPVFGSNASQAAQICSAESGNNPQSTSKSDKTSDGNSYSVGLFQINLTNSFNQSVDGQNCSAAFSKKCQGSAVVQSGSSAGSCSATVINPQLYSDCVAAAQNPTTNMQAAQAIYSRNGNWNPWSTSNTCGLHS
ncbi:MAG: hypothetical protein JWM39_499 [Parcubacteria group bacterium]|nr:hypothetical protein [Parcubacteria group bacterium]